MSKKGSGVHEEYKKNAQKGCDVLFRVKIKGRSKLVDDIPLHMSLKIFDNPDQFDLGELKKIVKEKDIRSPDSKTLDFEPIIFKTGSNLQYYMLKVKGLDSRYKALYDKYKNIGTTYDNFFTHITIDKPLYEDIKKNGIKPEEIEFSPLIIEEGAGNTLYEFKKSEDTSINIEIIKETIKFDKELRKNHTIALFLKNEEIYKYVEDNPLLKKEIQEKYLSRIKYHFGNDENKINHALKYGIRATYKE